MEQPEERIVGDEAQPAGGNKAPSAAPVAARRGSSRNRLTHPLTLALIPAVASVLVGIFALLPESDPDPQPNTNDASTSVSPPVGHEAGIAFRVETDLEEYKGGWEVAFDGPLPPTDDFPDKPGYVQAYSWAKTRGAVDVDESHLRLLLQNNGPDRVTVRSISAQVISRMSPINTTDVVSPSAGTNDLVALGFNLDEGDLVSAQPETLGGGGRADTSNLPFFSTKNVTLDPGESTDVKITTRTEHCHCLYKFQVVIVKLDSTTTLDIGDVNGRPLSITARAPQYQNSYENGQLGCSRVALFHKKDSGLGLDCDRPA
jgi:hypothetical protein